MNWPVHPSERPSVLILGANGRLGQAAATAFDQAGWRVVAQARHGLSPQLPRRAIPLRARLDDTAALVAALRNSHPASGRSACVVVHAVNPPYTRWDAEALPALHAALQVAKATGAHFLFPGNVYNFGRSMPPVLTETTPFQPSTAKGRLRVAMEGQIEVAARDGGFAATVLRAGDFLGPYAGTWLDLAIAKDLRHGRLVYPGPLDLPHAWAYLPDLARAFVRVAALPSPPAFEVLHFQGHTLTGSQLLAAIEAAVRSRPGTTPTTLKVGGLPWRLISTVGLVYPMWRELARMAYLWHVPHALDGQRLAARLGTAIDVTPLHEVLCDALSVVLPAARPERRAA